ncbi:unnamed protein product [Prorocentrum cordatum]|nr:unnamed protein product [Polarella glacialis]
MDAAGAFDGQMTVPLPGTFFQNGSVVETSILGKADFLSTFQRAQYQGLFGSAPAWGPDNLAGFLACPMGFLLVQYVIYIVHKVRGQLSPEEARDYWESIYKSWAAVLGSPVFIFDHLESSRWNITSFDIAVNLNTQEGEYFPTYEAYCLARPVPPPRFRPWQELWPEHPQWLGSPDLCRGPGALSVALVGEHGPSSKSTCPRWPRRCATGAARACRWRLPTSSPTRGRWPARRRAARSAPRCASVGRSFGAARSPCRRAATTRSPRSGPWRGRCSCSGSTPRRSPCWAARASSCAASRCGCACCCTPRGARAACSCARARRGGWPACWSTS